MSRRGGCLLAALKVGLGLAVFLVSGGLLYALVEALVGRVVAIAAVVVLLVLLPLGLTSLLLRSFRRLEQRTTFWANAPGLTAIWAGLVLLGMLAGTRAPLSSALAGLPARYPHLGRYPSQLARTVGRWLAPSLPAPAPVAPIPSRTDAGRAVATPDAASVAARPDATAGLGDAGRDADHDAGEDRLDAVADEAAVPRDVPVDLGIPAAPPELRSSLSVCASPVAVLAADLGQGSPDEIVVTCRDAVRILWLQAPGVLVERSAFSPTPPAGLERILREARVFDVDGDGRRDLLLCAHWTTERGGTRGGGVWWAPARANGQFGRVVRLGHETCGGVATGDIDGDGRDEIVVVEVGNPWQPAHPTGELHWYARNGRTWAMRGRTPVHINPIALWLADANHDGLLDAHVEHDWQDQGVAVCPGSRRGLLPCDPSLTSVPRPGSTTAPADLDGDGAPDRVSLEGGSLQLRTTRPLEPAPTAVSRALDFEQLAP